MAAPRKSPVTGTEVFSIGDVARATGLSTHTIRVWERRYGRPVPLRLPSGQRRYTGVQVRWLRLVAEALSLGNRPSKVVPAAEAQLTTLLKNRTPVPDDPAAVAHIFELVRAFDADAVRRRLRAAWQELGPCPFLDQLVAPLVVAIGRAWAEGELKVRHEHFVSELLEDFLRARRLEIAMPEGSPVLLLAALEQERHGIGLQMAGLTAAHCGATPRILGASTPLTEIAAAAGEDDVFAVGVSVSLATGGVETDREVAMLRKALSEEVALIIGGTGARGVRRGTRGVEYLSSLAQLEAWLRTAVSAVRGRS